MRSLCTGVFMHNPVLFRSCDASTPLLTLQRRRRWVTAVVMTWIMASGGMMESIAEFLFVGHSTLVMVAMISFTGLCSVLAIPAIVLIPIAEECEKELLARGVRLTKDSLGRRTPRYAVAVLASIALMALLHLS